MADEDDGAATFGDVLHFPEAFFLEFEVTDREDFVNEENFRLEMRGNGESEAHLHSSAEIFQRRIQIPLDAGKCHNGILLLIYLPFAHPQNRTAQIYIFAPGQFGMESSADFKQASHAAAYFGKPSGRTSDAREQFKQGRF